MPPAPSVPPVLDPMCPLSLSSRRGLYCSPLFPPCSSGVRLCCPPFVNISHHLISSHLKPPPPSAPSFHSPQPHPLIIRGSSLLLQPLCVSPTQFLFVYRFVELSATPLAPPCLPAIYARPLVVRVAAALSPPVTRPICLLYLCCCGLLSESLCLAAAARSSVGVDSQAGAHRLLSLKRRHRSPYTAPPPIPPQHPKHNS